MNANSYAVVANATNGVNVGLPPVSKEVDVEGMLMGVECGAGLSGYFWWIVEILMMPVFYMMGLFGISQVVGFDVSGQDMRVASGFLVVVEVVLAAMVGGSGFLPGVGWPYTLMVWCVSLLMMIFPLVVARLSAGLSPYQLKYADTKGGMLKPPVTWLGLLLIVEIVRCWTPFSFAGKMLLAYKAIEANRRMRVTQLTQGGRVCGHSVSRLLVTPLWMGVLTIASAPVTRKEFFLLTFGLLATYMMLVFISFQLRRVKTIEVDGGDRSFVVYSKQHIEYISKVSKMIGLEFSVADYDRIASILTYEYLNAKRPALFVRRMSLYGDAALHLALRYHYVVVEGRSVGGVTNLTQVLVSNSTLAGVMQRSLVACSSVMHGDPVSLPTKYRADMLEALVGVWYESFDKQTRESELASWLSERLVKDSGLVFASNGDIVGEEFR